MSEAKLATMTPIAPAAAPAISPDGRHRRHLTPIQLPLGLLCLRADDRPAQRS